MNRFLDWLFGRRHRPNWPRGARPLFPFVQVLQERDPALWEETREMSPAQALPIWQEKHPELFKD